MITKKSKVVAFFLAPLNVIVRECSWCGNIYGFKTGGKGVTSGICEDCAQRQAAEDKEVNT